jgi:hypothetical protein
MERGRGRERRELGIFGRLVYRALTKRLGRVSKTKKLAAHDTPTLLAATWMDAICASAKTIPIGIKELAQLKVAALVGCPF